MPSLFAVANVEALESDRLVVVNIYNDEHGQLVNQVIRSFDNYPQIVELLQEIEAAHVWTSDQELFGLLLQTVGIGVEYKHPSDTTETKRAVEEQTELLREIFEIEPLPPKEPLSKWRMWLIQKLGGIIEWLEKQ
ncbi:hypothetical protein [Bacillus sp. 37MA]|uniref:hypothetical protein n=1 Tax=Bacillus sp. 37MA TaxID=1132442 RepID=UPI00036FBE5F|nr:hypothetical protein [Bacillus sp. 37MA]